MSRRPFTLRIPPGTKGPRDAGWQTAEQPFEVPEGWNKGYRLDGMTVVDCDAPGAIEWWEQHGPPTPYVSESRPGRRAYWYSGEATGPGAYHWAMPDGTRAGEVRVGHKVQCVAPGSVHPESGTLYRWVGEALDTVDQAPAFPRTSLPPAASGQRVPGIHGTRPDGTPRRLVTGAPDVEEWLPNEWCPGREDHRTAGLTLGVLEDGRILPHCQAGCDRDDVIAALVAEGRYTRDELYPPDGMAVQPWDVRDDVEPGDEEGEADDLAWEPAWDELELRRTGEQAIYRDRAELGQRVSAAQSLLTFGRDDLRRIPPPSWLIPGRLQTGTLAQLSGPSGSGKSLLAMAWALELTTRRGEVPRRVLYLAAEGVSGTLARIEAWEAYTGRTWDDKYLRIRPDVPFLLDTDAVELYASLVRDTGPWDLVVIDTLSRATAGGDENSAEIMSKAVQGAEVVQAASGGRGFAPGAVLLVHHFGWEGTRQRGSSVLYAACDNVCYLTPHKEHQGQAWLSTNKLKDGEPGETELLAIRPAGSSVVIRAATVAELGEAAATAEDSKRDKIAKRLVEYRAEDPTASKTRVLKRFNSTDRPVAQELWDEGTVEEDD